MATLQPSTERIKGVATQPGGRWVWTAIAAGSFAAAALANPAWLLLAAPAAIASLRSWLRRRQQNRVERLQQLEEQGTRIEEWNQGNQPGNQNLDQYENLLEQVRAFRPRINQAQQNIRALQDAISNYKATTADPGTSDDGQAITKAREGLGRALDTFNASGADDIQQLTGVNAWQINSDLPDHLQRGSRSRHSPWTIDELTAQPEGEPSPLDQFEARLTGLDRQYEDLADRSDDLERNLANWVGEGLTAQELGELHNNASAQSELNEAITGYRNQAVHTAHQHDRTGRRITEPPALPTPPRSRGARAVEWVGAQAHRAKASQQARRDDRRGIRERLNRLEQLMDAQAETAARLSERAPNAQSASSPVPATAPVAPARQTQSTTTNARPVRPVASKVPI